MTGFRRNVAVGTLTAAFVLGAQYAGRDSDFGADRVVSTQPQHDEDSSPGIVHDVSQKRDNLGLDVDLNSNDSSQNKIILNDELIMRALQGDVQDPLLEAVPDISFEDPSDLAFDTNLDVSGYMPYVIDCHRYSPLVQEKPCSVSDLQEIKDRFDASFLNPEMKSVKPDGALKPFDCRNVNFPQIESASPNRSSDKLWRCVGSFSIVGGEGWRVDFSTAVKQDLKDKPSANRFGVCPEGDTDCLGTGLRFELEL